MHRCLCLSRSGHPTLRTVHVGMGLWNVSGPRLNLCDQGANALFRRRHAQACPLAATNHRNNNSASFECTSSYPLSTYRGAYRPPGDRPPVKKSARQNSVGMSSLRQSPHGDAPTGRISCVSPGTVSAGSITPDPNPSRDPQARASPQGWLLPRRICPLCQCKLPCGGWICRGDLVSAWRSSQTVTRSASTSSTQNTLGVSTMPLCCRVFEYR